MTKLSGRYEPHLRIEEISLLPGGEWSLGAANWTVIQVKMGSGYCLHPGRNLSLERGTVLVLAPKAGGSIRASQLTGTALRIFVVDPMRLGGLMSVVEQNFFQTAASKPEYVLRSVDAQHLLARRLESLCEDASTGKILRRLQLLQVFVEIFGGELEEETPAAKLPADAKERLRDFLNRTPTAELLNLSFADLVRTSGCTRRHLSRIFRDMVGMSFRDKHAELRLRRACELLATTEFKVVDVALESGYQSLSLFNLMFARRYGMSPGKWREKHRKVQAPSQPRRRKRVLALC